MAQTQVNIRMDEDVKRGFDQVCDALGITMSTAITILAKKMIREQRIPFEVSVDPFFSASNTEALLRSKEQLEKGQTTQVTLDALEGMADG